MCVQEVKKQINFWKKNLIIYLQSKPFPISSKMALMTRFLQLETTPDEKCLFTFLVTKAVTRSGHWQTCFFRWHTFRCPRICSCRSNATHGESRDLEGHLVSSKIPSRVWNQDEEVAERNERELYLPRGQALFQNKANQLYFTKKAMSQNWVSVQTWWGFAGCGGLRWGLCFLSHGRHQWPRPPVDLNLRTFVLMAWKKWKTWYF